MFALTHSLTKLSQRVAVTIAFSFVTGMALADTWSDSYRTITHIYPHDSGLTFNLDGAVIVPASPCENRFLIATSSPNYAVKVAALLAAHAQGKRIQINYIGTDNGCDVAVNRFITEN